MKIFRRKEKSTAPQGEEKTEKKNTVVTIRRKPDIFQMSSTILQNAKEAKDKKSASKKTKRSRIQKLFP